MFERYWVKEIDKLKREIEVLKANQIPGRCGGCRFWEPEDYLPGIGECGHQKRGGYWESHASCITYFESVDMDKIFPEVWYKLNEKEKRQLSLILMGEATICDGGNDELYEKLFEYYSNSNIHGPDAMPYDLQKGCSENHPWAPKDSFEWIDEKINKDFNRLRASIRRGGNF